MFYRTAVSTALLCFVLWDAGTCNAGLRRAETWTAESPDGKLIFVMIPPITLQEEEEQGNTGIGRAREIRNRFPSSGLYSTEPDSNCLWEADFYLNDPGYVSSDGRHVVVLGPFIWSSVPSFDGDAILYAIEDGCLVNTTYYYQLSQLWWIKRLVFGDGPQCEDYGLKPNVVWIKTNYWEEIEFDSDTGEVVSFRDPLGTTIVLSTFALIVGVVLFLGWLVMRRMDLNRSKGR